MASSFGCCGSIVLTDEPVDIDGLSKVNTFYEKYVNPPINLEGKTTEMVAWGLAQVLKLRELVPQHCSVEDIATNMPSAMTLFYADSGIENFGDWRTARINGEGGVFKDLFCIKDSSGAVIERLAFALCCNIHDLHSYDGDTTFGEHFYCQANSAARYLRYGQNHHAFMPLALYLAGEDMDCPLKGAGIAMASALRLPPDEVDLLKLSS